MRNIQWVTAFAVAALFACGGGGGGGGGADSGQGGNSGTQGGIYSSGLAACPAGKEVFTTPPVALAQVRGWEPLGHVGPPAHTFPTDHQYLYTTLFGSLDAELQTVPVVAPGNIRITQVWKQTIIGGRADYAVFFQPCADLGARFGHVVTLSADLLAAAGPIDRNCTTYAPAPGASVTQCQSATFRFDMQAGQPIGTLGGGGSTTLDWWMQDRRAAALHFTNPSRFSSFGEIGFDEAHIVPASDYFVASVTPQVTAKLGRYDGSVHRTAMPQGGTIAVDVDGTARGYWFNPSQAYPPESYHAALAPDYVTPDTTQVFSLGVSQGGVPFYATFTPQSGGLVNRAFESVTADGNLYCYEPPSQFVVLVQMLDATTLKIEVKPQVFSCAQAQPWAFSANAVTYKR